MACRTTPRPHELAELARDRDAALDRLRELTGPVPTGESPEPAPDSDAPEAAPPRDETPGKLRE